MTTGPPDFRTGRVLATRFTGTLSERHGEPVERLPSPGRLRDWLAENELGVDVCTADDLRRARELREAVHLVLTARATSSPLPVDAVTTVNVCSRGGHATATLTPEGTRRWVLGAAGSVADSLVVIAADAVDVVSGERAGRLALCASPTCRAVFLDTSQSRTRRWCDMNTCGNRQKKARFRASRTAPR